MKKLFIFGLILLLTLSIAACGGKSDTPASSPQNGDARTGRDYSERTT